MELLKFQVGRKNHSVQQIILLFSLVLVSQNKSSVRQKITTSFLNTSIWQTAGQIKLLELPFIWIAIDNPFFFFQY